MELSSYEYTIKLMLLGDSNVGKTSLMHKFVDDYFNDTFITTIGVDFKVALLQLGDMIVRLQIWDTAGQERFKTITANYYRNADGIILVYDVTNRVSFNHIKDWIQEIMKNIPNDVLGGPEMLLVGAKIDLYQERNVIIDEGVDLAKTLKIPYIEVSSKSDTNVRLVFEQIACKIIKKIEKANDNITSTKTSTKTPKSKLNGYVNFNKLNYKNNNCC